MYIKKKIFVFFLFAGFLVKGQSTYTDLSKEDAIKIFQKINQWYTTTPSYSFTVTHATYAGYASIIPYEQKKGYFKKFTSGFHSNLADIQNIQSKNYLITIDSIKKIILLNNPLKKFEESNNVSIADYQKLLSKCTSLKILNGKTKTLKIFFNKNYPINSYEICLNKDELFQSITVFYQREVKSKTGAMVKPKLSIVFDDYNVKITPEKDELNENKFFSATTLQLKDFYAGYTLLDQRIKNNKQ